MKADKSKLIDTRGRPLTQSLFLEIGYNVEFAVYTLKEFDYEYDGRLYPSLKRLYLQHEDPVEYSFVDTYLYNWDQWQRLCANKVEMVGSASYSGGLNSVSITLFSNTYTVSLPSTSGAGRAFKVTATFYSSDSGFEDAFGRTCPATDGIVQFEVLQNGEPAGVTFNTWSTPATIRSSAINVGCSVTSGGGSVLVRRVIGTVS